MDLKPIDSIKIHDKYFHKIISHEEIQNKITDLAEAIVQQEKSDFIFIAVMNGAIHFASDLSRAINKDIPIHLIHAKSYDGMKSKIKLDVMGLEFIDLENKNILLLEDIIDTGNTIHYLKETLMSKNASSVKICSLFFKPACLQKEVQPDYIGFNIGPEFIVGYGLDYNEMGRNLRDVYQLIEENVS